MSFTDKMISNLKAKETMYQVREGEGFGVRVLPSGLRIFIFVYTIAGKRRQMNLGDYPIITLTKARERLYAVKLELANGKDPQEVGFEWHKNPERDKQKAAKVKEDEKKNPTVKTLAKDYMEKHAKKHKRESSWTEDERLLNKDIIPRWGNRKASDIKRRDIIALLDEMVIRGPALAANIKKLLSKMFAFAVDKEILDSSPCVAVKLPAPVEERQRKLNDAEIKAFLTTELPRASMSTEVKRILQLILYTAQRPGEIAGMHRREIHGNVWIIPAERSKNGREHLVPLTEMALFLIGDEKGYIFPSPVVHKDDDGNVIEAHINENAVAYAIRRNLKDYKPRRPIKGEKISMVKVAEDKKMDMEHFTPHDLRRTANTLMAASKIIKEHRERVLNHAQEKLDSTYNLYDYQDEKQIALETLERKLNSIIIGKESNVIPITAKQKTA